jgi:hypothetical protein
MILKESDILQESSGGDASAEEIPELLQWVTLLPLDLRTGAPFDLRIFYYDKSAILSG